MAFYSRIFSQAELNYSVLDKEFLALVSVFENFTYYIKGRHVEAFTDHNPLIGLLKKSPINTRHARYILKLEEFDFDLKYIKGVSNCAADTLSRLIVTNVVEIGVDNVLVEQKNDNRIVSIINKILKGQTVSKYSLTEHEYLCYEGKTVVPENCISSIITAYHGSGHFSSEKVQYSIASAGYWFKAMKKRIIDYVSKCKDCLKKSGCRYKAVNLNLPKSPFIDPFQFVSIDLVGPLPVQNGGYKYLLTIIDHASRWLEAVPLTNVRADTCANAFISQWIYRYGPPGDYILIVAHNLSVKFFVKY